MYQRRIFKNLKNSLQKMQKKYDHQLKILINKSLIHIIMTDQQSPALAETYPLSRYRYVSLAMFIIAAAINSVPIQTLASISSLVQQKYNYSTFVISLSILLGPIMHTIMATPVNFILDRFGVRVGCTLGGIIVIVGIWLRCLMQIQNPTWLIIGSFLAACGHIFILSSPSAFAMKWFSNDSTPKIIATAVLVSYLSGGIGASLGGFVVPANASAEQIKNFLIVQSVVITIGYLLFSIFYRQKPEHPPSKAAANKRIQKKQPYILTIKKLVKNSSYMKVIVSMSFSYGVFVSFVSILDQSLKGLHYQSPNRATSTILGTALIVGTFSTFIFAKAIRITLEYKKVISLCLFGVLSTFILLQLTLLMKIESGYALGIMGACAGFFIIPLPSLFISYSAELTYPVAQGSATGYLFTGAQTLGFVFGIACVSFIDKTNKWKIYLMYAIHALFILIAFIVNLYTEQHLNKTNYELGTPESPQSDEQKKKQQVQSLLE